MITANGRCGACGRLVAWAMVIRQDGTPVRMPLDITERADGNIAVYRDHVPTIRARTLRADETPARYERRVAPHFATCPRATPTQRRGADLSDNVIPIDRGVRR